MLCKMTNQHKGHSLSLTSDKWPHPFPLPKKKKEEKKNKIWPQILSYTRELLNQLYMGTNHLVPSEVSLNCDRICFIYNLGWRAPKYSNKFSQTFSDSAHILIKSSYKGNMSRTWLCRNSCVWHTPACFLLYQISKVWSTTYSALIEFKKFVRSQTVSNK